MTPDQTAQLRAVLTTFQTKLLNEASARGHFSSYMVQQKSIDKLLQRGLIVPWIPKRFSTDRWYSITALGELWLREHQEGGR